MEPSQQSSVAVPIAIVFGFSLIALAIYFSGIGSTTEIKPVAQNTNSTATSGKIKPVDNTDYIRGNPNAPILIVEYSDYDCPFCKNFHDTMKQIMDEFGVTGRVAWVYRQFPIKELHPNSHSISEAALCAGELAGNDGFWKFSDLIFKERGDTELTNISRLPEYASAVGISKDSFLKCTESNKHQKTIDESFDEGMKLGIAGTPQSYVIIGNQQATIEGAQPYPIVKQIISDLIKQLEGIDKASTGTSTSNQIPTNLTQ